MTEKLEVSPSCSLSLRETVGGAAGLSSRMRRAREAVPACQPERALQVRAGDSALDALAAAVQTNCHICDSRQAADLSLCIYLLQMREFYRWETGLGFGAVLERDAIGAWLEAREALWSSLEARPFVALPFAGREFAPLDADALNAELAPQGLYYGAGLVGADRPVFFLARLEQQQRREDGLQVQVCGPELARGLFAPPASLQDGRTVVLRRESLARWLWEKFEAFSLRRTGSAFAAFVDLYAAHDSATFVRALPRLVDDLCETLLLHETGEYRAGQWLEPGWAQMRLGLASRRTDLHVRAVRDHIADLEVTLPALLESGSNAALHFWFANYEGVRERLFPSLGEAYAAWRGGDSGRALRRAAGTGLAHFRALAEQVLALHRGLGRDAGPAIEILLSAPQAVCGQGCSVSTQR